MDRGAEKNPRHVGGTMPSGGRSKLREGHGILLDDAWSAVIACARMNQENPLLATSEVRPVADKPGKSKPRSSKKAKSAKSQKSKLDESVTLAPKAAISFPQFEEAANSNTTEVTEPVPSISRAEGEPMRESSKKNRRRRKKPRSAVVEDDPTTKPKSFENDGKSTDGGSKAKPKSTPDFENVVKLAWKIYLAEVSEEGVALIGDQDARELSRRCFRLAEIFTEEKNRRN